MGDEPQSLKPPVNTWIAADLALPENQIKRSFCLTTEAIITLDKMKAFTTIMGELLEKQNRYFIVNEERLSKEYPGQFIVIHEEKVAGSFGSERDAYIYCVQHFRIGTFLIREIPKLS